MALSRIASMGTAPSYSLASSSMMCFSDLMRSRCDFADADGEPVYVQLARLLVHADLPQAGSDDADGPLHVVRGDLIPEPHAGAGLR